MLRTLTLLVFPLAAAAGCSDVRQPNDLLALTEEGGAAVLALPDTGDLPVLRRMASARDGRHDYGTGRPSRDGRFLPYVDWTTGDVAVHDFAADRPHLLTDKGTWGEDGSWAENAVFSPDGSRVVFLYGNVRASEDATFVYELRIINADGTGERVLRTLSRDEEYYSPTDWHPEHGILMERNFRGGPRARAELVTLDPVSGEMDVIFEAGPGEPHPHEATFSPDGRFVAVELGDGVAVLDLEGSETARTSGGRLLGWTPSGGGIVTYGRHPGGDTGFWHVPFDGRALGQPILVRGAVYGAEPIGGAGDRFFYTVTVDAPQVHVGTLDLRGGEILSTPTPVGSPLEGGTMWPAWSPDGRSLAYMRGSPVDRRMELMLRSADGSDVRRVAELDFSGARMLEWHPDGSALFVVGRDAEGGFALYRVGLERGNVETVLEGIPQGYAISPDGRRVYVRRTGDDWWGGRNGVAAVDLDTGEDVWFAPTDGEPGNRLVALSDGSGVLLTLGEDDRGSLEFLDARGTNRRTLATVERPDFISPNGSVVSAVGQEVLFVIWRDAEERRELWSVPLGGGEPRLVLADVGEQFALSPDGRRFAVRNGRWSNEIWALERVEEALASR